MLSELPYNQPHLHRVALTLSLMPNTIHFAGEYTTSRLTILMKELETQLPNSEAIRIDSKEIWILVKYGVRLVQFTKVSPRSWKCVVNKLGEN